MTNLNNLSPKEIFYRYSFPHKFYVRYLLDIAKLQKKPKAEDLKAIEVTELWLKGLATEEECRDAANAAYTTANAAYAARAAYAATAYAYAYAANATAYADKYKEVLINNINSLTDLEKIMIGLNDQP